MKENENYIQFKGLLNEGVVHLFTKKPFDFNLKNISEQDRTCQYGEIEKKLNFKFKKIIKPNQTHSNNVGIVDDNNVMATFEDTDGLITNLKGVALAISVADCQAIILYDKKKSVIGNVHSGWKGTLSRIVCEAVEKMCDNYFCNLRDIEIFIGPSILKCCFEVDEDVAVQFFNAFEDIDIGKYILKADIKQGKQKYYIDTIGINRELLIKKGVQDNKIHVANICTKCNRELFHSYRGNPEINGRNLSIIALKEEAL